jgi:hypothetical protein
MEAVVLPKPMYLFTKLYGSRSQNIVLFKMFHFSRKVLTQLQFKLKVFCYSEIAKVPAEPNKPNAFSHTASEELA